MTNVGVSAFGAGAVVAGAGAGACGRVAAGAADAAADAMARKTNIVRDAGTNAERCMAYLRARLSLDDTQMSRNSPHDPAGRGTAIVATRTASPYTRPSPSHLTTSS